MPDLSQRKTKSWRDHIKIHPAAELFPLMSEPELRELGEDIQANGFQAPIVLFKGKLLDGRNRLDATELVGVKFGLNTNPDSGTKFFYLHWRGGSDILNRAFGRIEHFDGDPYAFVISANLHRRHLTTEQKRELIAKLIKETPNRSDRQIAKQTNASPTWVGKIRKEAEATGDVSTVDTRTDTKGRNQPSTKPKKSASVPPKSQRGSVSAEDIALKDFTARTLELIRLTKKNKPERFANTSLPFKDLRELGHFFLNLALVCENKCKAEIDAKRAVEVAAILGEAAP